MTELLKNAQKIVLQTEEGPRSFLGYAIVDLSLNPAEVVDPPAHLNWGPRYRWTDMALYRVVDPLVDAEYAVHIVGRSVLYHRLHSSCRKGVVSLVVDLASEPRYELLRPCREKDCYPSVPWDHIEDLADDDQVAVEQERYTLHKCTNAADVIDQLRGDDAEMSHLALKLVREAAAKDSALAAVMTMERPL